MCIAVIIGASIFIGYQWTAQQQTACRAEAVNELARSGKSLPSEYPSHYDATLDLCLFFSQSIPPSSPVWRDFWINAVTGQIVGEEDSPGNAYEETCYFENKQVDCADFLTAIQQMMTQ
jgi:hypothetical protein